MMKSLLAASALAVSSLAAQADTLASWTFDSYTAPTGTSTSISSIPAPVGFGAATALHAVAATFSTPAGNGSAKSLSANAWSVGDYWQFSFRTTGYTDIVFSWEQAGSATGPRDFAIAYSIDDTSFTTLASYTVIQSTWSTTTAAGGFSYSFALPANAADLPRVTVRLIDATTTAIGGATVASGGTDRVDNVLAVGTVSAVPEAGTPAMLAAGLAVLAFVAARRKA